MREFLRSLAIQRRVLGAMIMRETYTRFGRENLGFAWMYGEFLIFALPVIVMWRVDPRPYRTWLAGGAVCVERLSADIAVPPHRRPDALCGKRQHCAVLSPQRHPVRRGTLPHGGRNLWQLGRCGILVFLSLCDWRDGLAAQYAIAFFRLFLHDLVVRRGRTHPRRIQRTQRHVRKSLACRHRICTCRFRASCTWPHGCRHRCGRFSWR